jgi:glycosyltransferase involved in cell wall biosynthesis
MKIPINPKNNKKRLLKISFVNGILVSNDAISNIMRDKINAISHYCECNHIPYKIRIFVQYSDKEDYDIKEVKSLSEIILDEHFLDSDIVFYEYGIYYYLFNTIALAINNAKVVIQYYGITPAQFVPVKEKDIIKNSYRQLKLIYLADKVIVYSEITRSELLKIGFPHENIHFCTVPISFHHLCISDFKLRKKCDGINFLFVGRFVESKGVLDLLRVIKKLLENGFRYIHLNLVGNLKFSNKHYIEDIKNFVILNKLSEHVSFIGTVSDEQLCKYYADSHCFVIPSYHEGFCVPVVEAFSHGSFVIAYNSGNLPEIVNGFGRIIQTGNIEQLYLTMKDYCVAKKEHEGVAQKTKLKTDRGEMYEDDYIKKVKEYAQRFTFESYMKNIEKLMKIILEEVFVESDFISTRFNSYQITGINDILKQLSHHTKKNSSDIDALSITQIKTVGIRKRIEHLFSDII